MSYSAVYTIQIYIPGLRCGSVSPINNKNWQAVALRDHTDILLFLLISLICAQIGVIFGFETAVWKLFQKRFYESVL